MVREFKSGCSRDLLFQSPYSDPAGRVMQIDVPRSPHVPVIKQHRLTSMSAEIVPGSVQIIAFISPRCGDYRKK